MDDRPGCLNEITGVFARRGFNVQSLAVGPSETEGRSRITMVVPGGSDGLQNLIKQVATSQMLDLLSGKLPGSPLVHCICIVKRVIRPCGLQVYKVIFVMKVTDMTEAPHIARELMMIKVRDCFHRLKLCLHLFSTSLTTCAGTKLRKMGRREVGLQLRCNATQRREIRDLVDIFKGNVSLLPFMCIGSSLAALSY